MESGVQFRPLASVDGLEDPQANKNETEELVDEWATFIKMDRKMRRCKMWVLRIIAEEKWSERIDTKESERGNGVHENGEMECTKTDMKEKKNQL